MDRLVGVGSGQLLQNEDAESLQNALIRRKTLISPILVQFHIISDTLLEQMASKYGEIYDNKEGLVKTEHRQQLAIAFSVCDVLNKEGIPRPPSHIASVCGVKENQMINLAMSLDLPEEQYNKKYVLTYASPHLYVDTICDYLEIPHKIALLVKEEVKRIGWKNYGKKPETIVGGVIMKVLRTIGKLNTRSIHEMMVAHVLDFDFQAMRRFERSLKPISIPQDIFKVEWSKHKVIEWPLFN